MHYCVPSGETCSPPCSYLSKFALAYLGQISCCYLPWSFGTFDLKTLLSETVLLGLGGWERLPCGYSVCAGWLTLTHEARMQSDTGAGCAGAPLGIVSTGTDVGLAKSIRILSPCACQAG